MKQIKQIFSEGESPTLNIYFFIYLPKKTVCLDVGWQVFIFGKILVVYKLQIAEAAIRGVQ